MPFRQQQPVIPGVLYQPDARLYQPLPQAWSGWVLTANATRPDGNPEKWPEVKLTGYGLPRQQDDCGLKADQSPTGLASVTGGRLVFIGESAGVIGSSGRATAHSEEILPLSEPRGAAGPDKALAGN